MNCIVREPFGWHLGVELKLLLKDLVRKYSLTRIKCELVSLYSFLSPWYYCLFTCKSETRSWICILTEVDDLMENQKGVQGWACFTSEVTSSKYRPIFGCCDAKQSNDDCHGISTQGLMFLTGKKNVFMLISSCIIIPHFAAWPILYHNVGQGKDVKRDADALLYINGIYFLGMKGKSPVSF